MVTACLGIGETQMEQADQERFWRVLGWAKNRLVVCGQQSMRASTGLWPLTRFAFFVARPFEREVTPTSGLTDVVLGYLDLALPNGRMFNPKFDVHYQSLVFTEDPALEFELTGADEAEVFLRVPRHLTHIWGQPGPGWIENEITFGRLIGNVCHYARPRDPFLLQELVRAYDRLYEFVESGPEFPNTPEDPLVTLGLMRDRLEALVAHANWETSQDGPEYYKPPNHRS